MFELTGPRSTALLQEVLDLYDEPNDITENSNEILLKPRVNDEAHKVSVVKRINVGVMSQAYTQFI
jgi:hypothetical protein